MPADLRGAAPSGALPLKTADVKYIAVHCSATPPDQDIGFKEIDRMHRMRGFLSCGYHFIVRRDGTLEPGRDLSLRGAHVEGFNHCSVGICLIGGVDKTKAMKPEANFTEAQLMTLATLVKILTGQFPHAETQGHRDFPNVAEACPSFNVTHWLATGDLIP